MKDLYKRTSREWGSKARKEDGRNHKARLKVTEEELESEKEIVQQSPALKKNYKKWCKGKVGKKHEYYCVITENPHYPRSFKQKCSRCGREEGYWSSRWCSTPKPDWVPEIKEWHREVSLTGTSLYIKRVGDLTIKLYLDGYIWKIRSLDPVDSVTKALVEITLSSNDRTLEECKKFIDETIFHIRKE